MKTCHRFVVGQVESIIPSRLNSGRHRRLYNDRLCDPTAGRIGLHPSSYRKVAIGKKIIEFGIGYSNPSVGSIEIISSSKNTIPIGSEGHIIGCSVKVITAKIDGAPI